MKNNRPTQLISLCLLLVCVGNSNRANAAPQQGQTQTNAVEVLKLWPNDPPGEPMDVGKELDTSKASDKRVAGKRVMRLTNVSAPELHVFLPPSEKRNGCSVVICPGGGFYILAWDLEGTEVAAWLNSIGVSAFVLKYRVPTHSQDPAWKAPAQDAQRAISLVRSKADQWGLAPDKIGVLGFSAGGVTAVRTCLADNRYYDPVDSVDAHDCKPDFSVLIYPGGIANKEGSHLLEDIKLTEHTPPAFLVHAFDDFLPVGNSLLYAGASKQAKVPAELHVFDFGGHGFGLRPVAESPITGWPKLCQAWLQRGGWIGESGK